MKSEGAYSPCLLEESVLMDGGHGVGINDFRRKDASYLPFMRIGSTSTGWLHPIVQDACWDVSLTSFLVRGYRPCCIVLYNILYSSLNL